ncbi:LysE family translocator [Deinococcus cavernae]|uniref:LysE family translocator n=1 Tax=Deinococcus cavernae TaxID=2320857 RepID=A0A418V9W9_9DEIO|nr:LysE family translocator [Deinococcus cavernae]RJF72904.1 LysE family translocator [Deinococcus cavernae]
MTLVSALLGFAVVAGLMTITPGLDTALVLRSAITQGRREAVVTALGICTGVLVWAVAAAVGISALLTASEAAYTVLKVVGTAYMLWLGFGMLRAAFQAKPHDQAPTPDLPVQKTGLPECFQRGLLTNLLNPKVGAFYVALLPQFMPADTPHLLAGVLLGLVHTILGMLWLSLLAYTAHRARAWLSRPKTQRLVDGIAGTAVIGFGLKLGLSRH